MKRENSFAKAAIVRTQGLWKVYWKRADLKWHSYEPALEVAASEEFLAVVQQDEYGCYLRVGLPHSLASHSDAPEAPRRPSEIVT
ncbi:MAG: DUF3024 domain-containing protein [Nitrosospira sp.]|nr:DUF3024 domain-containing protein [Nitrosospira sp.]